MLEAKRIMLEFAPPKVGDSVLDAGCGLGDDTRDLAELVGPTGRVIGIDSSETMIDIARKRSEVTATSEEFIVGDVHTVDYPESTFDLIRSERTLQWLTDPSRWLDEMLRVLKPGGRFVICDTDFGTAVMADGNPEHLDRLVEVHMERVPNPREARMIPKRFRDRGLTDIAVGAAFSFSDAEGLREILELGVDQIDQLHRAGIFNDDEYEAISAERQHAFDTNSAYWLGTMIVTAGTKPT